MSTFNTIQSNGIPARRVVRSRRGFTLTETALMMVICGVGVMAILELLAAGSMSNVAGAEVTSGSHLAGNIREVCLGLAFRDPQEVAADPKWEKPETWKWNNKEASVDLYDDVKDLDGCTFSPPLDAWRKPIAGYEKWAQVITVDTVAEDHLASLRPKDPTAPAARVTVKVTRDGRVVHTSSWVAMGTKKPKA
jgi:hypothetical protein